MENMHNTIAPGDTLISRKKHACGGDRWTVLRAGADFRIRCESCGRMILMDRETVLRNMREMSQKEPSP